MGMLSNQEAPCEAAEPEGSMVPVVLGRASGEGWEKNLVALRVEAAPTLKTEQVGYVQIGIYILYIYIYIYIHIQMTVDCLRTFATGMPQIL
jgi:hypothetical protein